ncbi:hypothetical protein HB364_04685 [Pseudoflavitalea sp. X16]|uniref:hypothetical protein n=1 Tax=Paraflavitalea devenefica TaxID=2716334 RepID=UPI00141DB149|nr:hypothetical protein [Paraflavitalea devenefica]NII24359.1 hypothetical protein [Paraflavitalea devenefica]
MSNTFSIFVLLLVILLQLTACGPAIKKFVNEKYPPVSSIEKATTSVKNSLEELERLPAVDLGVRLDEVFLDSLLNSYFRTRFSAIPDLGIPQIEKLELVRPPDFTLSKQELIVGLSLQFTPQENKYVKHVWIDFSGQVSPSMHKDSLKLELSFSKIFISKLKLKRCLFLGRVAKQAVNSLCASFMNNINGQLKTFAIKINYPPFPEVPLSSLVGQDEHLTVTNDYTFKLSRKTLHPVILIKPGSINILAGVDEKKEAGAITANSLKVARTALPEVPQPNYIMVNRSAAAVSAQRAGLSKAAALPGNANDVQLISIARINSSQVTTTEFDDLFNRFDEAFTTSWNGHLDALPDAGTMNSSVALSYHVLARITDELFRDAQFGLRYSLNIDAPFKEQTIDLGEIPKPDCGAITFQCNFNNCSNVISNCGSCKWYNVGCQARWAACQALNGVKYAACQASNAAKATWCAGELVARKTLCFAEIAGIFIYDNLIRDVGKFGGFAKANGTINGTISEVVPGGISSLGLNGQLNARANAEVGIRFTPSGILGHLICFFPLNETIRLNNITVNQAIQLRSAIERQTLAADNCQLTFTFQKMSIPIQLSEPLLLEILRHPMLSVNCGFSIGLGITVTAVLALAGNEKFKIYLNLALLGRYVVDVEKAFSIKIPSIPLEALNQQVLLSPSWGAKSLVFTKK